jgi:MFS transporter, DHA1 family, inner membrane transport protein
MQKPAQNTESTHWPQIALLYATGMLAAFQYAKVAYMLPGLQAQTAMSTLQQALALSVIGLVGALLGACAGALCQALGLRRTLLWGLCIGAVGAALPLLASHYGLLLAARGVESAAHMAIVVTVPTIMLGLCAQRDRARVMAVWSCYFTVTFIAGAVLMPPLVRHWGWQAVALVHAAALLVVGVLCAAWLRPAAPAQDGNIAASSAAPHAARSAITLQQLLQAQLRLLMQPRLLVVPATFFGYTLLFVALVNVLPRLLGDSTQAAVALALWLPVASLLGTVVALLTLGRGIAGHRLVRWSTSALLIAAVSLLVLPAHGSATYAMVLLTFVCLGTLPAGIISSVPALLGHNDPQLSLVNGGIVQFGNLGNFVGSPILATLLVQLGWRGVGVYLLMGALIVSLSLVFLRRGVLRAALSHSNTAT